MPRYMVRTKTLITNANSLEELQRLVRDGKLPPDGRVREMPSGRWSSAAEHPALADVDFPRSSDAFPNVQTAHGSPIASHTQGKPGFRPPPLQSGLFSDNESTVVTAPPSAAVGGFTRPETAMTAMPPLAESEDDSEDEIEELDPDELEEIVEDEDDEDARGPSLSGPEPEADAPLREPAFPKVDTQMGNPVALFAAEAQQQAARDEPTEETTPEVAAPENVASPPTEPEATQPRPQDNPPKVPVETTAATPAQTPSLLPIYAWLGVLSLFGLIVAIALAVSLSGKNKAIEKLEKQIQKLEEKLEDQELSR